MALTLLVLSFWRNGEEVRVSPNAETLEVARGPAKAMLSQANGHASAPIASMVSKEDIGAAFAARKIGGEMIGLAITHPRESLTKLGFRDGDILTYVGEEAMNADQTPDQIQTLLRPGTRVFVGRGGREVELVLP